MFAEKLAGFCKKTGHKNGKEAIFEALSALRRLTRLIPSCVRD